MPGEIAEMMLDGTLCEGCGVDMGNAGEGFPRYCSDQCARDRGALSCEPLLGPLDIAWALSKNPLEISAGFIQRGHFSPGLESLRPLDLIISGSESGPRSRACDLDWHRQLRDQCVPASAAYFLKQHAINGRKIPTPELDGRRWMQMPGGHA